MRDFNFGGNFNFKPNDEYVDILPGNNEHLLDDDNDNQLLEEELNHMLHYQDEESKVKDLEKQFHSNMELVE